MMPEFIRTLSTEEIQSRYGNIPLFAFDQYKDSVVFGWHTFANAKTILPMYRLLLPEPKEIWYQNPDMNHLISPSPKKLDQIQNASENLTAVCWQLQNAKSTWQDTPKSIIGICVALPFPSQMFNELYRQSTDHNFKLEELLT